MNSGNLQVDVLSDGEFRLDGGAMFGMVPRERWEGLAPPDERNRIRLGTHGLLVRGASFCLVIEPGTSPRMDPDLFAVVKEPTLEESLAGFGVAPGDVTHVAYTHLHFDHTGGGDRFTNATCLVQKREWEAMSSPHLLHTRSYIRADRPPEERTTLLDGEAEPLPGVRFVPTGGHTPGHQIVILEDAALFWGDLMPTRHHLSPARFMAYDLDPKDVAETKVRLLEKSADRGWVNFLYHDLGAEGLTLERKGRRYDWIGA